MRYGTHVFRASPRKIISPPHLRVTSKRGQLVQVSQTQDIRTAPLRLRREVAFRQADVTRAARGAAAAGLCVSSIKIGPDGVIEVLTTQAAPELTDAFDEWKAKRDARRPARN
jgi:hypothetical protein